MSTSTQKMPRPTSRDAPKFDSDEPENLRHFLGQMEDLFSDYSITDDDKKKKKLVRYTDAHTEEEWQALDEYTSGTFTEFKEAVLKNYPEAADAETGTWERLTFLTEAKKLQKPPVLVTNRELVEKFTESLSPSFREHIDSRLSIKQGLKSRTTMPAAALAIGAASTATPVKRWEDMHTLEEVVAEADDIVFNTSTSYLLSLTSMSMSSTGVTSGPGIKAEMEEVKQQVATLLDHTDVSDKCARERQDEILRAFQQGGNNASALRQSRPQHDNSGSGSSDFLCWYDWKPGHFVKDCQNCQKHIVEGLLKVVNNRFVMADGSPIPREPAQLSPMDRVLAWHNSQKQEQLFWEEQNRAVGVYNLAIPKYASLYASRPRDTRDEVIEKLRQDLQYWQTSTQANSQNQTSWQNSEEEDSDEEEDPPRQELPFRDVPSVSFAPLLSDSKKTRAKSKEWADDSKVPAYKHMAPIHKEGRVQDVVSKVLKMPIVLNAEELMDLSEPLRKEIAKLMSKKRVATQPVTETVFSVGETQPESVPLPFHGTSDEAEDEEDLSLTSDAINIRDLSSATFMAAQFNVGLVPAGSLIMTDPYLQYLDSLVPGEKPKPVIVAKDSASLRAVYPLINGIGEEESVVDGGSQIVSMAGAIVTKLGIAWDPDIVIHMQSANGQLEKTLGLARNVPFLFNDITMYLQVHVINSLAYKVLLGRPFDVLTKSVIKNQADGGQIITITDPNTS
ncbi:uncharacterized protein EV420DRAFT_1645061 [Desarmillaria tabescens]|uniref:Uncharacterized protein n=1 Tax=Armillaria tabescens TaxID=1929756 RepID=A0AA39K443_ARMTA|nr:uncharacterized protein EV420DRAFT_1645061 [Desarmillaria tabescens]KAK0454184.1 hypothetical protein EV420DRAFT_1645061 [Desarmillaria tabescens]